jgi:regulator of protease activity HflC (stomatin/prohibitin superfamily)
VHPIPDPEEHALLAGMAGKPMAMPNQQAILQAELGENKASIENTVGTCVGETFNLLCLPFAPCGCGSFKEVTAGYEGLILRFGVFQRKVQPGRHRINCMTENIMDVYVRTEQFDLPPMVVITKDTLTCTVDAICYFQVVDAVKASLEVVDYRAALRSLSIATLRTVIGEYSLDALLVNRGIINARITQLVDEKTDVWGIKVQSLEMQQVVLNHRMKLALATVAEAKRDSQGKTIKAKAARDAAELDRDAATLMAENPTAMSIKYMETIRLLSENEKVQLIIPDRMPDHLQR